MLRLKILAAVLIAGAGATGTLASQSAGAGGCLPAGNTSRAFRKHIIAILTRGVSDTNTKGILNDMGIVDTSASSVVLVSNDSVCAEMQKSSKAYRGLAYDSTKAYVVKVGINRYIAYEPPPPGTKGGYTPLYVADTTFVYKGLLSY